MNGLLKLSRGIDNLIERLGTICNWLVLGVIVVAFTNVVIRFIGRFTKSDLFADMTAAVFGTRIPQNMLTELQWYMYSALFLLGFGYILKHGTNVRVDFLYSRWTPRRRALVDFLGTLLLLIPFCLLGILVVLPQIIQSFGYNSFKPLGGPNPIGALITWLGDVSANDRNPVTIGHFARLFASIIVPSAVIWAAGKLPNRALRAVVRVVAIAALALLTVNALMVFGGERSADPGGLPRSPAKAMLIVGFVLLLIQAVSQAIKYLAVLRGDTRVLDEIKHDEQPEVEAVLEEVQERAKTVLKSNP